MHRSEKAAEHVTRIARVAAFGLVAIGLAACSDDGGSTPGSDTGVADAGDTTPDVTTEDCTGVVVASSTGATCGGVIPCGAGLQCSRLDTDTGTEGTCRQVCVPETCESVCADGEQCVPLNESPGTGVCAAPPTGERGAYETCSDADGYCSAGLSCVVGSMGATEGVCLPPCVDAACPPVDGRGGQCVIVVGQPPDDVRHCAPSCSALGADDECPGAMSCLASGPGFVCAFGS